MTDEATKPRVVLIDLSSLWWAAYHVNSENGVTEPRKATLDGVKRCVQPGDLVVVCCDSGRSFRKDISAEYKANREKQPPAAYAELDKTKERLRADGFLLWECSNFEADDVIASACDMAVRAGHDVRICSADKDLMALLGPKVDMLRTHTWSVVGVKEFTEKYRIRPVQFTDWLALKGDSSDNVPGCDGCGDKWASDLISRFESVTKLYAALDAGKADLPKGITEKLIACRDRVALSRRLVELNFEAPIKFEEIHAERKVSPLTENAELPPADDREPNDVPIATEPVQDVSEEKTVHSVEASAITALVPVEYERQLEPRSMRSAVWLGHHLYDSRLYTKFPTPEAITAVILRGREMGLGAATALDNFHVIEGKPCPYAYLIIARAKAHPECEYLYCSDASPTSATWVTKNRRNPVETRVTYTFEQAQKAGLVKPNSAWTKHPEDQVVKTAGVKLSRREYPSAALGLYAVIEMGADEE